MKNRIAAAEATEGALERADELFRDLRNALDAAVSCLGHEPWAFVKDADSVDTIDAAGEYAVLEREVDAQRASIRYAMQMLGLAQSMADDARRSAGYRAMRAKEAAEAQG